MYMSNIFSYFMQISHVSCIWPMAVHVLFILNTRHNRGYIFCPESFGYCKPRFIPTYVSICFEIEIGFLNLPQFMFQEVFRQGIVNLQESITMYSALLVNLMCISVKLSLKSPATALRVIWILAGNCLTMVTSISRHDFLSWHRPHTKNIKSMCNYVMTIAVNQFGSSICYNYQYKSYLFLYFSCNQTFEG